MGNLIRKPAPLPEENFNTGSNQAAVPNKKKKSALNATVAVTKETRNNLNAMRKIKELSNVDDLLQKLLQREYEVLSEEDKANYDLLKKLL